MAPAPNNPEHRSKVAEACIVFGADILTLRPSSATPEEIQDWVKELFGWFEEHDAFTTGNHGIAIRATSFARELLESRKTATVDDALAAIRNLYLELSE